LLEPFEVAFLEGTEVVLSDRAVPDIRGPCPLGTVLLGVSLSLAAVSHLQTPHFNRSANFSIITTLGATIT
jgi:hypothetical protein